MTAAEFCSRIEQITNTIIDYSVKVKPGDKVLIRAHDLTDAAFAFVDTLVRKIRQKKATPLLLTRT